MKSILAAIAILAMSAVPAYAEYTNPSVEVVEKKGDSSQFIIAVLAGAAIAATLVLSGDTDDKPVSP